MVSPWTGTVAQPDCVINTRTRTLPADQKEDLTLSLPKSWRPNFNFRPLLKILSAKFDQHRVCIELARNFSAIYADLSPATITFHRAESLMRATF